MNVADVLARYRQEQLPEFEGVDLQSVGTRGLFGNQPLHVACARGRLEEIEPLVVGGAYVNARGEHGDTPLHDAVRFSSEEVARYLLARGADPSIRNEYEQTALDIARLTNRDSMAVMLGERSTGTQSPGISSPAK
jgi:ankyrin repeat protein